MGFIVLRDLRGIELPSVQIDQLRKNQSDLNREIGAARFREQS
jgi:hypothetical protein